MLNPNEYVSGDKNKEKIVTICSKPKGQAKQKLEGAGRKPFDEQLEEGLFDWVVDRRNNGLRVSRKLIMFKAKSFYMTRKCEHGDKDLFIASRGWMENFMKRYGLSLRRKTTIAQHDPNHLIDKLVSYILHTRRYCRKK